MIWGPAMQYALIASNLADGKHKLHIKVLQTSTSPSTGNSFQLLNVLKAANIGVIAPIAKIKTVPLAMFNGGTVSLDGSGSFDPLGKAITSQKWSIVAAPQGSTATITADANPTTSFKPDVNGDYELGLKVCNGADTSVQTLVSFNVRTTNGKPISVPGNDTTIATKTIVKLNGLGSNDPETDPLTYLWTVVSTTSGVSPILIYPTTAKPQFETLVAGEYVLSLVVSDAFDAISAETIKITAIDGYVGKEIVKAEDNVQISPNPVKAECSITYSLSQKTPVAVTLFSITGKKMFVLVNENEEQGEHQFTVDLKSMVSSGIYFIQIQTTSSTVTKKIVVE